MTSETRQNSLAPEPDKLWRWPIAGVGLILRRESAEGVVSPVSPAAGAEIWCCRSRRSFGVDVAGGRFDVEVSNAVIRLRSGGDVRRKHWVLTPDPVFLHCSVEHRNQTLHCCWVSSTAETSFGNGRLFNACLVGFGFLGWVYIFLNATPTTMQILSLVNKSNTSFFFFLFFFNSHSHRLVTWFS